MEDGEGGGRAELNRRRSQIRVACWVSPDLLRTLLSSLAGLEWYRATSYAEAVTFRICRLVPLVVDLSVLAQSLQEEDARAFNVRSAGPLILMGRLSPRTFDVVRRLSRCVDSLRFAATPLEVSEILTHTSRDASASIAAQWPQAHSLPRRMREVLEQALENPDDWTVKRLAAELGTTRRSLERSLRARGLPPPAALLNTASSVPRKSKGGAVGRSARQSFGRPSGPHERESNGGENRR